MGREVLKDTERLQRLLWYTSQRLFRWRGSNHARDVLILVMGKCIDELNRRGEPLVNEELQYAVM